MYITFLYENFDYLIVMLECVTFDSLEVNANQYATKDTSNIIPKKTVGNSKKILCHWSN